MASNLVQLNISVSLEIAEAMHRRADEQAMPISRYLSELVEQDARGAREMLAEEGYRVLGQEAREFSEAALPLAKEAWQREGK